MQWHGEPYRIIFLLNAGALRFPHQEIGPEPDTGEVKMKLNQQPVLRHADTVSTRIVKESRWIHHNQLELGMYVNELDRPWEETSFMFQGFTIDSYDLLRKVQESSEYVNVQTEKLARVSSASGLCRLSAVRSHR